MTSETLHQLYDYLVPLVTGAYREASRYSVQGIEKKELNDIATFTDRFMEQAIVEGIRQRFPDHTFIGEEYGENRGASPYEWLIDPIDGTVNFAAGIPMFGTTLALRKNKETIFGIIFDWPNNTIYYAIKGEGAYCGTVKLRVSQRSRLDESIVSICLTSSYNAEYSEKVLDLIQKLQPYVRGIRIIVCTVYELIWLATGKSEAMINVKPSMGLSSCAGKLIVSEAGGTVTNLSNKPRQEIDDLLITNSVIHDAVYNIIAQKDTDKIVHAAPSFHRELSSNAGT